MDFSVQWFNLRCNLSRLKNVNTIKASFSGEQNTYNNLKNSTVSIKPSVPIILNLFQVT